MPEDSIHNGSTTGRQEDLTQDLLQMQTLQEDAHVSQHTERHLTVLSAVHTGKINRIQCASNAYSIWIDSEQFLMGVNVHYN